MLPADAWWLWSLPSLRRFVRAFVPDASGALLLEDEVRERIDECRWGIVELVGPAGAGKSAALAHLAHIFPSDDRLYLIDQPRLSARSLVAVWATKRLVVCASSTITKMPDGVERWRLAPWSDDEWIEYLLSVHSDQCASVMRRIKEDRQRRWLGGLAGLCRMALDRLAADETLVDVKSAIRQELDARLPPAVRSLACERAFIELTNRAARLPPAWQLFERDSLASAARSLLCYAPVNLMLAAEFVAHKMLAYAAGDVLNAQFSKLLAQETAALARHDESLLARLREVVAGRDRSSQSTAASLLHAADIGWVPDEGPAPSLRLAYLAGARWPGVRLSNLRLFRADLTGADLSEAQLEGVSAGEAKMSGVRLHGAQLTRFRAVRSEFSDADLSFVRAPNAKFRRANFRNANLEGALLTDADFKHADLGGARCCRANLAGSSLMYSEVDDADFCGANLARANLGWVVMRGADFTGANFARARLIACDMEYMQLAGPIFDEALLWGAHLTGSRMPDAKFRGAGLRSAGLADVDWPNADLRDADLRGATFHMGSSRSGLVGSPIACEGSRTGFYTDEYHEQDFKSPEEIRKANLCGADLRGADIKNVDFYLVDLRGAKYTSDQEAQFRASGAILETRV